MVTMMKIKIFEEMLTSIEMVNTNFREHSIVLNLRFPQRRTVVGYQYQLSCKKNITFSPNKLQKKKAEILFFLNEEPLELLRVLRTVL